jgi:hypothetical protein
MNTNLIVIPIGLLDNCVCDFENQTCKHLANKNQIIKYQVHRPVKLMELNLNKIFFKIKKNIWIFRPVNFLPFNRFNQFRKINLYISSIILQQIIRNHFKYSNLIIWIFTSQLEISPKWFWGGKLAIYDCVDYTNSKPSVKIQFATENNVVVNSDIVFANSAVHLNRIFSINKNVYQVPLGFDINTFKSKSENTPPTGYLNLKRPIICFTGNINTRFDFNFLNTLIKNSNIGSYVFIGPIDWKYDPNNKDFLNRQIAVLKQYKNVRFIKKSTRNTIKKYLQNTDFGIIPYDVKQPVTKYSYPMKIMEFFYYGKPVISTNIEELKRYNDIVLIGQNPFIIADRINKWKTRVISKENSDKMKLIAESNSWNNKFACIDRLLLSKYNISIN